MDRSIGQRSFDGGRSDCSSVAGSTRSYGSSIPLFLASELNAKQYREKKAQANELDALKAEIARQQRDIVLLRRQIQTRNVQIEEVTEELNDCTVESLRNSFDMDSSRDSPSIDGSSIGSGFSHRSSAASLERLTRLSTPLSTRTRQKVGVKQAYCFLPTVLSDLTALTCLLFLFCVFYLDMLVINRQKPTAAPRATSTG